MYTFLRMPEALWLSRLLCLLPPYASCMLHAARTETLKLEANTGEGRCVREVVHAVGRQHDEHRHNGQKGYHRHAGLRWKQASTSAHTSR